MNELLVFFRPLSICKGPALGPSGHSGAKESASDTKVKVKDANPRNRGWALPIERKIGVIGQYRIKLKWPRVLLVALVMSGIIFSVNPSLLEAMGWEPVVSAKAGTFLYAVPEPR